MFPKIVLKIAKARSPPHKSSVAFFGLLGGWYWFRVIESCVVSCCALACDRTQKQWVQESGAYPPCLKPLDCFCETWLEKELEYLGWTAGNAFWKVPICQYKMYKAPFSLYAYQPNPPRIKCFCCMLEPWFNCWQEPQTFTTWIRLLTRRLRCQGGDPAGLFHSFSGNFGGGRASALATSPCSERLISHYVHCRSIGGTETSKRLEMTSWFACMY